jgi:hypothetical protein
MTRIEKLGERVEETLARQPVINMDVAWGNVVFEAIAGIRALAEQIAADTPVHERHLLRLLNERDQLDEGFVL